MGTAWISGRVSQVMLCIDLAENWSRPLFALDAKLIKSLVFSLIEHKEFILSLKNFDSYKYSISSDISNLNLS